jgi:hypothetical protein
MTFSGQGNPRFPVDLREEIWSLAEQVANLRSGPLQQGMAGWTYDPQIASGQSALSVGVEYLVQVVPVRDGKVKTVTIGLHTAGATLTADQCFAGVRHRDGTLLAKTASQHTNWAGALFEKRMALDAEVEIQQGVPVYACFVANGSTPPQFARLSTSDVINAGCVAGQGRSMFTAGSQTDLAASRTMTSLTMTNVVGWWAAIA